MSVVKVLNLFCDECGNWDFYESTTKALRRVAKRKGWTVKGRTSEQDLCPDCAQRKRPQQQEK